MSDADRLEKNLEHDREHLRETLGALEDKMSPGRLLDEAMAYFDTGPKAFASDLTTQVRNNPMPALLTGVGIAWLMMSDRKAPDQGQGASRSASAGDQLDYLMSPADYEAWQEYDRLQQAEWACVRLDDETAEAHARRLNQARAAAIGLDHDPHEDHESFSTRVRHATDSVKQKGAASREKLKQAAASAKHAASSAKHGVGSAASHSVDGIRSAAASTRDGAKAAISSGQQLHENNPVATAAIGVAIGALLGAAIPLSRQEERALGDVADKGLAMGVEASRKASDELTGRVQEKTRDDGADKSTGSPGTMSL